ncbi:MAG TPA: protein-export chaperone SecB [Alphaproteobacteria bacterium]|nr:protein-export chaperone SecB [Alphaproteobacteria bacterium]
MAEQQQPTLMINSQYIKDLSLEIPHAPEIFKELTKQPQLRVDVSVETEKLEENTYIVDLNLALNGDLESKKLFILELTYSAVVTLTVPEQHLDPILNIEIPRLTFPFARNIVTQCLMEGGLPPMMLTPVDFAAVYAAKQARQGQN